MSDDPQNDQEPSQNERTTNWEASSRSSRAASEGPTNDRSSDSSLPVGGSKGLTKVPREFGRYRIEGILGKGGMGAVYLALDTQLDRQVALKIPHFGNEDGPEIIERFYREARAMATLHHPNLCPVYDVGDIGGTHYLTMAYIDGQPLNSYLKAKRVFASTHAADVVRKLAAALHEAHKKGIVHRDLKPANIMIDGRHEPVIMDFGLARREHEGEVHLTKAGAFLGTPAYMSPEQIDGDHDRTGPASDIYSLGVVLYTMLTGQMPFEGSMARVMAKIITETPKRPSKINGDVDPGIEAICLRAMEKAIEDRYASAGEMAEALQAFLGNTKDAEKVTDWVIEETMALDEKPSSASGKSISMLQRSATGERRQVTVLYCGCDLMGSEEDSDELDPEERQSVLSEYKQTCGEIVSRLGGTVLPSDGEEFTVCFGYPMAYEDSAPRAVRSGLEILGGLGSFNQKFQQTKNVELSVWAAVHTGLVVVGDGDDSSTGDGIAIVGEARNVATRMESLAEPETLIISEATLPLVQGYFECESRGKQKIRGVRASLEIFQVLREIAAKTQMEAASARLTPLIGRDREIGLLEDRWEEAEEGAGQVVLLAGEAGLGKSRLVHAIREHVINNTDSSESIIEWRCSPYHAGSGLHPATEYFVRQLAVDRDNDPVQKLAKLVAYVESSQMPDSDEAIALLGSLLSIPLDDRFTPLELTPQRQKEKTLELLLDWIHNQAAQQPLLFIVEDLHWIDPSTIEFLGQLVEQGQGDSLLMVFTFRPDFQPPWSSLTHQTQIGLNRLRKKQIIEMMQVNTGLKEVPPEIADQIVDRTGGVPLFVEEFTKMVQETGGIGAVDGEVAITDSFSLAKIPATLRDLLMARLDRMDANREVMQLGAALGREFTHELIEAVWPDSAGLQEELDKLVDAEVLNRRGRPPKCTYQFKHALIQDAAYGSLLKTTRQEFHQAIAESLEKGFADVVETQPELLARHFTEAGMTQPAIQYWLLAGQRSQTRSANDEAISQFRAGLGLVASLDESPERDQQELGLLMSLGVVYMATLGWGADEVGETFQRAREICEKLGAHDHEFNILWGTWGWRLLRAEYDVCLELAADSTRLAEDLGHPAILMEAPWIPGCTQFYRGDFSAALEDVTLGFSRWDREASLTTTLATGQNCGVTYQIYLGLSKWYLGYPEQAVKWIRDALELVDDLKHPFTQGFAKWHASWLYSLLRDGVTTEDLGKQAFDTATEHSFPIWKFLGMVSQGVGMHLQGNSEAGIALAEPGGGALLDVLRSRLNVPHFCSYAALIHAELGNYEQATGYLDRELQYCHETNGKYTLAEVHRLRGKILLDQSPANQAEAEKCFREAISIAQHAEAKSWELRAAMSLAKLLQVQDKRDEAHASLAAVYEWFTEGFDTPDLMDARDLLDNLA
ncbi:MAG: protein kinase [Planctomycetes bacterium]|nr:protein kinase [Planctomycetota bacterium]